MYTYILHPRQVKDLKENYPDTYEGLLLDGQIYERETAIIMEPVDLDKVIRTDYGVYPWLRS